MFNWLMLCLLMGCKGALFISSAYEYKNPWNGYLYASEIHKMIKAD